MGLACSRSELDSLVGSIEVLHSTLLFNIKANTNHALTHSVPMTSWAESVPLALPRYFENTSFVLQYGLGRCGCGGLMYTYITYTVTTLPTPGLSFGQPGCECNHSLRPHGLR